MKRDQVNFSGTGSVRSGNSKHFGAYYDTSDIQKNGGGKKNLQKAGSQPKFVTYDEVNLIERSSEQNRFKRVPRNESVLMKHPRQRNAASNM